MILFIFFVIFVGVGLFFTGGGVVLVNLFWGLSCLLFLMGFKYMIVKV